MSNNAEQLFLFSSKRNITSLFKEFLMILEEINKDHSEAMGRLIDALPADQKAKVILADHLTHEKMDRMRKRILSSGNDCYRSVESLVEKLNIDFK